MFTNDKTLQLLIWNIFINAIVLVEEQYLCLLRPGVMIFSHRIHRIRSFYRLEKLSKFKYFLKMSKKLCF